MVVLENISKCYRTRRGEVYALRDVNLRIEKGEFAVLCGPSGSGKTTLLMTIAAMLRPSSGRVCAGGRDVYAMTISERARFRAENIGFVFQMFHLVPYLNIVENVLLAGRVLGRNTGRTAAEDLLRQLGLGERATHKPAELSAGEKQRAAIVRALFNQPKIILADEPTGNLDPGNASAVLGHLAEFHTKGGTVILATHGPAAREFASRTVRLRNGAIEKSG
ncbi:MAG TPA: ABC transporter ATP-binding protein [Sedimentisphaerales bacterium]|nr:ABC transporter ATP-binding protein [Sedimentisphaerales bacterium]